MGIFSRFTDIINSNITSLLDKAEDPEKMLRLMIQEMEDTLIEIRTTLAKSLAEQKQIGRKMQECDEQLAEWQDKAELAIKRDREDLARLALIEKQKVIQTKEVFEKDETMINEAIDKMRGEIVALEQKLAETRSRQQTLNLRQEVAGNSLEATKRLTSSKTEAALARFEQLERRIDHMNAQAEAFNLGKSHSLTNEFETLKADDAIENELANLKMKIQDK